MEYNLFTISIPNQNLFVRKNGVVKYYPMERSQLSYIILTPHPIQSTWFTKEEEAKALLNVIKSGGFAVKEELTQELDKTVGRVIFNPKFLVVKSMTCKFDF